MAEEYRPRSRAQEGRRVSRSGSRQAGSQSGSSRSRSAPKKRKGRRSGLSRVAGALLYVLFVIGISAILATMGWIWACDLLGLNKEYASTIITIPESAVVQTEETDEAGATRTVSRADMDAIVDQLEEEGLIQYKWLFQLYARFSHADRKIVPGTYELNTEMDYRALVVNMSSSSSTRQEIEVTIPEGYSIDQVFALLEERGVCTADKLEETAAGHDYAFSWLAGLPLGDYHRLEGYLFPDTYIFYMGDDPLYVINKMLVNFDSKMDEYLSQFTEESQYSLHDTVIIASLIEKETDGEDYQTISSVIRNRLENPSAETVGYLQIDATLAYLNGGQAPTEADKSIDSPYNTYLYPGLPAGPISNPGMASLYAAMNPESTKYYYYVLNPETGRHDFSRTLSEHQQKVEKYAQYVPPADAGTDGGGE